MAPAIPGPFGLTPDTDLGIRQDDSISTLQQVTLAGTTDEAYLEIEVRDVRSGSLLGQRVTRQPSFTIPVTLSPGVQELEILLRDYAGNARTFTHRVFVDPTAPYVKSVELLTAEGAAQPTEIVVQFTVTVASAPFAWQNADLPEDVDGNSLITPLDVLQLINVINERGSGELTSLGPDPASTPPLFLDVNGDRYLTPTDVLEVINYINNRSTGSPEGEGVIDVGISAPVGAQGIPAWSAEVAEEGNGLLKMSYSHPDAVWDGFSAGTAALGTGASRETALAELPALAVGGELDGLVGDIASEVDRIWHGRTAVGSTR